jgi:SMC interacting uncharacterized protein involved in chromosome segregation
MVYTKKVKETVTEPVPANVGRSVEDMNAEISKLTKEIVQTRVEAEEKIVKLDRRIQDVREERRASRGN